MPLWTIDLWPLLALNKRNIEDLFLIRTSCIKWTAESQSCRFTRPFILRMIKVQKSMCYSKTSPEYFFKWPEMKLICRKIFCQDLPWPCKSPSEIKRNIFAVGLYTIKKPLQVALIRCLKNKNKDVWVSVYVVCVVKLRSCFESELWSL